MKQTTEILSEGEAPTSMFYRLRRNGLVCYKTAQHARYSSSNLPMSNVTRGP